MEKEFTFRLNPWQSAVFLVVITIGLVASSYFKFQKAYRDKKKGVNDIIIMLKSNSGQRMLKDIKGLDPDKDKKAMKTAMKNLVREINLELISYDMRGHILGDMVFRMEYKTAGFYPDGEKYHYYQLPYSVATGWDMVEIYRTDENNYNSAVWKK